MEQLDSGRLFIMQQFTNGREIFIMAVYGYHRTSTTEQHLEVFRKSRISARKIITSWKEFTQINRPERTLIVQDMLYFVMIFYVTEIH